MAGRQCSMSTVAPTPEQIAAEVAHLRDVQRRVPPHSAFGDNNPESSEYALESALQAHDWMTGEQAGDEPSPAAGWEVIAK